MKKLDRDPTYGYTAAVKETVAGAIKTHSQNNQIDLYEEFFTGEQPDHMSETISLKTLMIFKDPNNMKRAITKIKWHSDNSDVRVAVSYASLRFQQMPRNMPTNVSVSSLIP
jgi:dynein intermediate chain 2